MGISPIGTTKSGALAIIEILSSSKPNGGGGGALIQLVHFLVVQKAFGNGDTYSW